MKIGVIGSRSFEDYKTLQRILYSHFVEGNGNPFPGADISTSNIEIVSGGATGADSLAERFAREHNLKCTIFKPDWEKYGKAAGFLRNSKIVAASDVIVAFWDLKSRGTLDSINKAMTSKKDVLIVPFIPMDRESHDPNDRKAKL